VTVLQLAAGTLMSRGWALVFQAEDIGGDSCPLCCRLSSVSIVLRIESIVLILLVLSASVTIC
jgi:hypothetical protein